MSASEQETVAELVRNNEALVRYLRTVSQHIEELVVQNNVQNNIIFVLLSALESDKKVDPRELEHFRTYLYEAMARAGGFISWPPLPGEDDC